MKNVANKHTCNKQAKSAYSIIRNKKANRDLDWYA